MGEKILSSFLLCPELSIMAMGTLNEVPSLLSLQFSPVGLACVLHEVISPSFHYSMHTHNLSLSLYRVDSSTSTKSLHPLNTTSFLFHLYFTGPLRL